MNNKLYKKLLWGTGFVIVAVILTLFIMSQTYIQNLVYHERLNQMEEVTHQMFRSLEDVIDTHWDEVNVQCNYLYYTPLKTDTEFYRYLKKLSELSNYHERQIELIAVDSAGHYYTENGRMGLLRGMKYLESAPQRVSYVWTTPGWCFWKSSPPPSHCKAEKKRSPCATLVFRKA